MPFLNSTATARPGGGAAAGASGACLARRARSSPSTRACSWTTCSRYSLDSIWASSARGQDVAERQVDALADRPARLGDGVPPVVLGGAGHDEQAAVRQLEAQALFARVVPEVKGPRRPQRDRRPDGALAKHRLVVGLVADPAAPPPEPVPQPAAESPPHPPLHPPP